jgi:bromodomain-containing protein 7/9
LESGPTTPLPGRKLLVFILDRLQKKDTHGVFSEPVDPEELPDYHDIIEHPMDFGTVRKKLDKGVYSNLEQLEADVLLICSNAMQYNPPNTVFFRQAKSIQELAKRDFENLRQEGEDGELQPKVVRRGRPPTKHLKKQQQQQQPPLGGSPAERVGLECATLATFEDNSIGPSNSNAYNLRRPPPPLHRFHSNDATPNSHRSRNANASADNNNHSEYFSNWNEEFPASILKADMKYGNKQFLLDETRRDTYKEFHPTAAGYEPFALYNVGGDMKQLMAVGLHSEHGYARSLARFAANLGPVVWKVASKKFSSVLPPGVKLGPAGLATENSSSPSHLQRNGFKAGVFGYNNNNNSNSNSSSQVGGLEIASSQIPPCSTPANKNPEDDDGEEGDLGESSSKGGGGGPESGKLSSVHNNKRQYGSGVPPDLNVRIFGPGSPNSSATAAALRIASPKQQQQHPDLALQL